MSLIGKSSVSFNNLLLFNIYFKRYRFMTESIKIKKVVLMKKESRFITNARNCLFI